MNPLNEVNIKEAKTIYDIRMTYHSDMKCQNYDAKIEGVEEANGKISITPDGSMAGFLFHRSDPDRVIAIAQMMIAFAQSIKKENAAINAIDTSITA